MVGKGVYLPLYVFMLDHFRLATAGKTWKTLYMDKESDCYKTVHNEDMAEGDLYVIKSDSWQGSSPWASRPSECKITFNFDNRIVAAQRLQWWCLEPIREPFLALYDDCDGKTSTLLDWVNCSSSPSYTTIESQSSCISLYHYRGHVKSGYFFTLQVTAQRELLSFPAGGYAAIIIISLAIVLVVIKIICVIYDWIRKSREHQYRLGGNAVLSKADIVTSNPLQRDTLLVDRHYGMGTCAKQEPSSPVDI